jgi:hypothetical protein
MTDIQFKNTRIDHHLTPFHDIAKSMAKAFGYTADLELDPDLAQLFHLTGRANSDSCGRSWENAITSLDSGDSPDLNEPMKERHP